MASHPTPLPSSRARRFAPWLLVSLAAAALYLPPILEGGLLYGYDTVHEILYRRMWGFGQLAEGRLPLWNPHILCGSPFFVDTLMGVAYPPSALLHLVLGTTRGIDAAIALHVLLAGLGMLAWLRAGLGLRAAPSVLGACVYMLGAQTTGHVFLGSVEHLVAFSWWPLGLLCVERAVAGRSRRAVVAAAFVLAASITGGHLQFVYMGLLAWGLYALTMAASGEASARAGIRSAARAGALVAAITLCGAALAAYVVLPIAELYPGSIRAGGVKGELAFTGASLPPWQIASLVAPTFFGDTVRTVYWGEAGQEMVTAYLGLLPLMLALCPAPPGARRPVAFFRGLALFGLVMALGRFTPLARLATHALPFAAVFRHPARWLALFALGGSVAAAAGLEGILDSTGRGSRRPALLVAPLLAAGIVALVLFFPRSDKGEPPAWFARFHARTVVATETDAVRLPSGPEWAWAAFEGARRSILGTTLLLAAVLGWAVLVRRSSPQTRTRAAILAVAITLADLASYSVRYIVTVDPADYLWGPEVGSKLAPVGGAPFRVATIFPSSAVPSPGATPISHGRFSRLSESHMHRCMVANLSSPGGFSSLIPRAYLDLALGLEALNFIDWPVHSRAILDLLGVRYLLVPSGETPLWGGGGWKDLGSLEGMQVWENEQALPRAFFPERVRCGGEPLAELRSTEFDPRRVAFLTGAAAGEACDAGRAETQSGEARFVRYGETEIVIDVESPAGGWLVLTDAHSPGWRAAVDGAPTPIARADLAFRAVQVPAGRHEVRFEYRPNSLVLGAGVTALALTASLAVLCLGGRPRRRRLPEARGPA